MATHAHVWASNQSAFKRGKAGWDAKGPGGVLSWAKRLIACVIPVKCLSQLRLQSRRTASSIKPHYSPKEPGKGWLVGPWAQGHRLRVQRKRLHLRVRAAAPHISSPRTVLSWESRWALGHMFGGG